MKPITEQKISLFICAFFVGSGVMAMVQIRFNIIIFILTLLWLIVAIINVFDSEE